MKAYHISDNDLDGVGSLYLSELVFTKDSTFIAAPTRNIDGMVRKFMGNWDKDTLLIITDLSVSEEVAIEIDNRVKEGYQAVLLDHHPTALALDKYEWATVKIQNEEGEKVSATSLHLQYLNENHNLLYTRMILQFTELVRSYDCWDWKITGNQNAKRLNDILYIVGRDRFRTLMLNKLTDPMHHLKFEFNELEEYLLDVEQERIQLYVQDKEKQMKVITFLQHGREYKVGVLTVERYHSELGNILCTKYPELDFVAMTDLTFKKISFRANKPSIDVSIVAKEFDGGGHPPAAGCSLNPVTSATFLLPLLS